jgi:hypothetical protein
MSKPAARQATLPYEEQGSRPLSVNRERFAVAVAAGEHPKDAYVTAGFKGSGSALKALRFDRDVKDRIAWLLRERIRANAQRAARQDEKEADARLRLIRELEAIAYVDVGDLAQWDRKPRFDADGALVGYDDVLDLTPSSLLTKAQRAAVKSVSRTVKKDGTTVRLDTSGKEAALALLAKILGMTANDAPAPSSVVNNTQVNLTTIGDGSALEAARRLAFALEKAARALPATPIAGPIIEHEASHAQDEGSKG